MSSFLEAHMRELNERQLEAVVRTEGPVLVLAGAGSGKTRVLTYRIAHLIFDHEIPVSGILAMTFSNKAAREMHDRIVKLLGADEDYRLPWVSTFHSVCARLLRAHGSRLGYNSDFVIYDESEQESMVKSALETMNVDLKATPPDLVHARIGQWKNEGKTWEDVQDLGMSTFDSICTRAYKQYTIDMQKAQAVDFDDLLLLGYRLFAEHEDIRARYHEQWRYILIDEFQDTNDIQYKLMKQMLSPAQNVCVVGDDDQSIYGWRGAKVENILNFHKEFENCAVIKLEQNYRSTANILKAASSVISKNELRHEKTLWTDQSGGERIRMAALEDDRSEVQFVLNEIKKYMTAGHSPEDIAVLYRMNSLSRGFEEECLRRRIPYRIVGGFRFYERKEIKDILAYMKLLMNPADVMAFRRTVNCPLRGVGKTSVEKLEALAAASQKPIAIWLKEVEPLPVTGKAREGLHIYRDILKWGLEALDQPLSFVDLVVEVLRRSRYVESLEAEKTEESLERLENIKELMSAIQEFEETWSPAEVEMAADVSEVETAKSTPLRQKLRDFLERISLIADWDQVDEAKGGLVTFMSLHAAKGLEFPVCFICGMEEGLFPSARSFDDYQRTEEERRLCYVGITRAKDKLYLTRAERRRTFGSINFNVPSRFLKDIPSDVLESTVEESSERSYYGSESSGAFYGGNYRQKTFGASRPKAAEAIDPDFGFDFDQRVDESDFPRGTQVAHPSFGDGIVQKSELLGSDECLTILFSGRGIKKVLAKFVTKR